MRFIHTADWHLGNQMHDIDRKDEVQAFFNQLKNHILQNQIGTLIVSGDVFDTANPSSETRRSYLSFLSSFADTCCKNIVIVGGNHDSALTLDCSKEVLSVMRGVNVHVVGSINNLEPKDMVFELYSKNDEVEGICIALPFVRELELRNFVDDGEKISDKDLFSVAYKKLYDSLYEQALILQNKRSIPIIATGHLYAANLEGRLSESSSSKKTDDGVKVLDVLGTLGNVPASVFPPVDYVALGHIHYSTTVAKNPAIRYSGSPFIMGFDEARIPHCVLDVQLLQDSAPIVEKIQTEQINVYQRITGSLEEVKAQLLEFKKINPQKSIYIEVCYKKEIGTNARDFLDETIKNLPQNVEVVSWRIIEDEKFFESSFNSSYDAAEIKNLEDKEIFTRLILEKANLSPETPEARDTLQKFLPLFLEISEGIQE